MSRIVIHAIGATRAAGSTVAAESDSVCAVQLGNHLAPLGLPVYNLIDNQLPA